MPQLFLLRVVELNNAGVKLLEHARYLEASDSFRLATLELDKLHQCPEAKRLSAANGDDIPRVSLYLHESSNGPWSERQSPVIMDIGFASESIWDAELGRSILLYNLGLSYAFLSRNLGANNSELDKWAVALFSTAYMILADTTGARRENQASPSPPQQEDQHHDGEAILRLAILLLSNIFVVLVDQQQFYEANDIFLKLTFLEAEDEAFHAIDRFIQLEQFPPSAAAA